MMDGGAFKLTESPILSSNENLLLPGITIENFNNGDLIDFTGRNFHYVNLDDDVNVGGGGDTAEFSTKPSEGKQAPSSAYESKIDHLETFLDDDIPLIVSDALLEPINEEHIDSIFS
jgi:hypothetical protein